MRSKRKALKDILPRLEQLLARTYHFDGLHIEALDGFITALICTRSKYSILDYLPLIMGKTAHPDIYSPKEWKEFQDLSKNQKLYAPRMPTDNHARNHHL